MGTRIKSFNDLLASNLKNDENFFINHVTTFSLKVQSLIEEARKRESLPTFSRIRQIQDGWKGRVDIPKSLIEKGYIIGKLKECHICQSI